MARSYPDERYDWTGGLNTTFTDERLQPNQLTDAARARLTNYGGLSKMPGSKRVHDAAIGSGNPVLGVYDYNGPQGKQLIAIADGKFYHKAPADADFTEVVPSPAIGAIRMNFTTFRVGAEYHLFFGDGSTLWRWDGTTLSEVTGTGVPAATRLANYHSRVWALDDTKRVYGSKLTDPLVWDPAQGGFFGDVTTVDDDPLVHLEVIIGSLLLAKPDSVARFTGIDDTNIRIDRETEGVSSEVGLVGPNAFIRAEEAGFMFSDRGPYLADEAGVRRISLEMDATFDALDKSDLAGAVLAYNRGAQSIACFLPGPGESTNLTCYEFFVPLQVWTGPHVYPFGASCIGRLERTDGSETVVVGGYDGRVRELDVLTGGRALDDVNRDGTGGVPVKLRAGLPMLFPDAPGRLKFMRELCTITADLGTSGRLFIDWQAENASGGVEVRGDHAGMKDYPFRIAARGRRIFLTIREETSYPTEIAGFSLEGQIGRRR